MTSLLYKPSRLLVLRARRRGFVRLVKVVVLGLSAVASGAFLAGFFWGGA